MNVFRNIVIQPSYGKRTALVTWDTAPDYLAGDFYIFKSPDGAGGWEQVNTDPISGTNTYEITNFLVTNLNSIPHFRILLEFEGATFDSPVVGLFDDITRREYRALSQMMRKEYIGISRGNGMRILHYIPKTKGTPCSGLDADTGQQLDAEGCPIIDPAEECFGEKFKGGFRRPILSWCRLDDTGPTITRDKETGFGMTDEFKARTRMLAFPHPRKGHLIVNHRTDDRYVITELVKPYKFRGLFPVAYDTQLELLPRSDVRYRVPIPDPFPEEETPYKL